MAGRSISRIVRRGSYSTSAGTLGSGRVAGGSGKSNARRPFSSFTRTRPPRASLPNSSSSASGYLMFSWMTRASGLAPNSSS